MYMGSNAERPTGYPSHIYRGKLAETTTEDKELIQISSR